MPIEPDTKDWTWVLNGSCGECGLSAGDFPATKIAGRVRRDLSRWEAVLRRRTVAERSDPGTWSDLEYAALLEATTTWDRTGRRSNGSRFTFATLS